MRLVLNIIWFVLAGLWMALGYALAALICFIPERSGSGLRESTMKKQWPATRLPWP